MKRYNNLLFIGLVIMCVFGCSKQNDSNIVKINAKDALEIKNALVNNYFENLELIVLETTKESLLSECNRLIDYKDNIYILDKKNKSVFVFDKHGKFKNKIKRVGKGPGEYIQLTDFAIDENSSQIILLCDIPNCLIFLDLEGKFIKQEKKDMYDSYISVDNGQLYYASMLIKDDYHIRVVNNNKIKEVIKVESFTKGKEFYSIYPNIIKSDEMFYFKVYDNIVYKLSDGNVKQRYYLDFGDKMIKRSQIEENNMNEIIELCIEKELISRVERFKESNKYIYFSTWPYSKIFLYDKTTSTCQSIDYFYVPEIGLHLKNYIGFDGNKNSMIFKVNADIFRLIANDSLNVSEKSHNGKYAEFSKVAEKLNEFDNPILIQCTFK